MIQIKRGVQPQAATLPHKITFLQIQLLKTPKMHSSIILYRKFTGNQEFIPTRKILFLSHRQQKLQR